MTTLTMELAGIRTRTRWCMAGSFGVHLLLLLAVLLLPRALPKAPALTEFTLLEPGDLAAGGEAAAPSAPAAASATGALAVHAEDESFRRANAPADIAPEPQNEDAISDRLNARLATLQDGSAAKVSGVAESRAPIAWPAAAVPGAGTGAGNPSVRLTRGGALGSEPSLALTRGGGGHSATAATAGMDPVAQRAREGAAPATASEAGARRVLSGATMAGPIANRPVVATRKPLYPDWAKHDMVEGSVTLYFIVRPDGSVKENVLVQRTAGFEDFDESARVALRGWRFAPLTGGRTGEQWGTITFNFRLQEAG
jgi:TonB family protein